MVSIEHITVQYGERTLFGDVSFMVGPHDRIGLVGSNGAGKSTLLRVIGDLTEADRGAVAKARYVTVGYLPQDGVIASGKTLVGEAETAFEDILLLRQEIDEAGHQLATRDPSTPEYAELLEIFGELQHKLEDLDEFRMQSKIERVLMGLGFSVDDFRRLTEEFSGGWQMRIALAKLLLREPSLLLLDEPTNHLDLESLQWLEEYLRSYQGAIMLVSHDRAFLDSLTSRTLALTAGRLESFAGNYTFYETEKVVRREQQLNAYKNQQKQLQHTQDFIDRFRYKATKARQVQSRIKQLEKIERVEIDREEEEIHFHFPAPVQSGVTVLQLRGVRKTYGPRVIFSDLDLTINRGDRIAVVGVNGAGKSTLSRILAGVEPIERGERSTGHNVILSYYAQHQAEELDLKKNVLEVVDEVAAGEIRTKLRTILGSFLFHGDDVFKKVSVLSGGEKSRLALAKMLLQPANVLIMDEPTNHLDMRSKRVLQEALAEYGGTYVIVSHDRAFLDPLINTVFEVRPDAVKIIPGTVSDYLLMKKREMGTAPPVPGTGTKTDAVVPPQHAGRDKKRLLAEERQARSRQLRPLRKDLESTEQRIASMEARKVELEQLMSNPEFYKDGEAARSMTQEYKLLQTDLPAAYETWERLTEAIGKAGSDDR